MRSNISSHRVKSAYFSEEESTLPSRQSLLTDFNHSVTTPADVNTPKSSAPLFEDDRFVGQAVQFPSHRGVLWNRSNFGSPVFLTPSSALSCLHIPPLTVTDTVEQLLLREENNRGGVGAGAVQDDTKNVLLAVLMSSSEFSDGDVQALSSRCPLAASLEHYVLSLSNDSSLFNQVNCKRHQIVNNACKCFCIMVYWIEFCFMYRFALASGWFIIDSPFSPPA